MQTKNFYEYQKHVATLPWPIKLCTLRLQDINWPDIPHLDSIGSADIESGIDNYAFYFDHLNIPKLAKFRRLCWEFADCDSSRRAIFREIPQLIVLNSSWQFNLDYDIAYGCQRMQWAKIWGFKDIDAVVHDVNDILESKKVLTAEEILAMYPQNIHSDLQFKLNQFSDLTWPSLQLLSTYALDGCRHLLNGYTKENANKFKIELDAEFSDQQTAMIKLMASTEYSFIYGNGWRITILDNEDLPSKHFNFPLQ